MSLQDNLNAEAEFIGSIVAELEAEKDRQITWMCEQGNHGTPERRYMTDGFRGMYSGKCAGTVFAIASGSKELECSCSCHDRRDDITTSKTLSCFKQRETAERIG